MKFISILIGSMIIGVVIAVGGMIARADQRVEQARVVRDAGQYPMKRFFDRENGVMCYSIRSSVSCVKVRTE